MSKTFVQIHTNHVSTGRENFRKSQMGGAGVMGTSIRYNILEHYDNNIVSCVKARGCRRRTYIGTDGNH